MTKEVVEIYNESPYTKKLLLENFLAQLKSGKRVVVYEGSDWEMLNMQIKPVSKVGKIFVVVDGKSYYRKSGRRATRPMAGGITFWAEKLYEKLFRQQQWRKRQEVLKAMANVDWQEVPLKRLERAASLLLND